MVDSNRPGKRERERARQLQQLELDEAAFFEGGGQVDQVPEGYQPAARLPVMSAFA